MSSTTAPHIGAIWGAAVWADVSRGLANQVSELPQVGAW